MADDTRVVLFEGANDPEDDEAWLPSVWLDHDADRSELYVGVSEEVASMAEDVPFKAYEAIRERLAKTYPYMDGEVLVLGPECFISPDHRTIAYAGVQYVIVDEDVPREEDGMRTSGKPRS